MNEEEILAQLIASGGLQKLIDAGLVPEREKVVEAQQQRFEPWMQGQQPQGMRGIGPYGTYVAANPLEHLAAAFRQGAGMGQIVQGNQALGQLIGQQGQGRGAWMNAIAELARRNQGQQPLQQIPGGVAGDIDPNT